MLAALVGIKTDGAFRLARDGDKALILTPIPDSGSFYTEIDLEHIAKAFHLPAAPAPTVTAVEPIEPSPDAIPPDWKQEDRILFLSVDAKSFAYRIVLFSKNTR